MPPLFEYTIVPLKRKNSQFPGHYCTLFWERRATRGFPQESATTTHQTKLAWALQLLPDDDPRCPLSLRNAKSPTILAQHVASLSQKPCSFNLH